MPMASLDPLRRWDLIQDESISPRSTVFHIEADPHHAAGPGSKEGLGLDLSLLNAVAEPDRRGPFDVTDHASTPPIPVPSVSVAAGQGALGAHRAFPSAAQDHWHQPSPFEAAWEKRRSSITFHPRVTIDTGHEKALDEPLTRSSRWRTGARPRGRSMLKALADQDRADADADADADAHSTRSHEPFPAVPIVIGGTEPADDGIRPREDAKQPTLLRSDVDELAQDVYLTERDRLASLTSATSSSPPLDDITTPPESPGALLLSPVVPGSLPRHPASAEEPGVWRVRPEEYEPTRRTKSDAFERCSRIRPGRRSTSLRSAKSISPASAYLSTWGKAAAALEPDDEGQEVGDYVLGKQIGFGGFSVVREAWGFEDGRRVQRAVKIVRKQVQGRTDRENEQLQAAFEHEVSLWRCLSHRFVLPLLVVYDTPRATFCFTELHTGGNLFDLVRSNRNGLPARLAKRYACQLASALRYLHEDVRVVHRDVKLENCLIDISDPSAAARGGNVLLCDFGMAAFIPDGGNGGGLGAGAPDLYDRTEEMVVSSTTPPSDSSCINSSTASRFAPKADRPTARSIGPPDANTAVVGSLEYVSPESLLSTGALFSTAADIWAYGVVLYALLVGNLPFRHTFLPRLRMMIQKGEWDESALRHAPGIGSWADDAVELVRGCLEMNPDERWTIRQVLDSTLLLEEAQELEEVRTDRGWML